MSWLFSAAMMKECESLRSLPELVEAFSEDTCSDGEPFAPLSVMPTPHKFWRNDKTMEFSDLSRFGLTCAVLTESRGEELLMLFLAGFPAKTLAAQERAQESPESAADCGQSLPGLLAKYDPATHLLKTAQCSLFEDSTECYATLPRWGLMQDGALYLLPIAAPRICEREYGLWPTPNVPNGGRSLAHVTEWSESGRTAYHNGKKVQVGLESAVKLWLTPRATDTGKGEKQETFLARMGDRTDRCAQSLPAQVNNPKTWPLPKARDWKDGRSEGTKNRHSPELGKVVGQSLQSGVLNPTWVEWLMGWPLEWTDLKPLETDRCQFVQQQHSEFYQEGDAA